MKTNLHTSKNGHIKRSYRSPRNARKGKDSKPHSKRLPRHANVKLLKLNINEDNALAMVKTDFTNFLYLPKNLQKNKKVIEALYNKVTDLNLLNSSSLLAKHKLQAIQRQESGRKKILLNRNLVNWTSKLSPQDRETIIRAMAKSSKAYTLVGDLNKKDFKSLKEDPKFLRDIGKSFLTAFKTAKASKFAIEYISQLPQQTANYRKIILAAANSEFGGQVIEKSHLPEAIQKDAEIMLASFSKNPEINSSQIHQDLLANTEFIYEAATSNPLIVRDMSDNIAPQKRKAIIIDIFKNCDFSDKKSCHVDETLTEKFIAKYAGDQEILMTIAKSKLGPHLLCRLPQIVSQTKLLEKDRAGYEKLVLTAINHDFGSRYMTGGPEEFDFPAGIDKALLNDNDFMQKAIKINGAMCVYMGEDIKNKKDLIIEACKHSHGKTENTFEDSIIELGHLYGEDPEILLWLIYRDEKVLFSEGVLDLWFSKQKPEVQKDFIKKVFSQVTSPNNIYQNLVLDNIFTPKKNLICPEFINKEIYPQRWSVYADNYIKRNEKTETGKTLIKDLDSLNITQLGQLWNEGVAQKLVNTRKQLHNSMLNITNTPEGQLDMSKPMALFVLPEHDHNKAMQDNAIQKFINNGYNVLYFEAKNKTDLIHAYRLVGEYLKRYNREHQTNIPIQHFGFDMHGNGILMRMSSPRAKKNNPGVMDEIMNSEEVLHIEDLEQIKALNFASYTSQDPENPSTMDVSSCYAAAGSLNDLKCSATMLAEALPTVKIRAPIYATCLLPPYDQEENSTFSSPEKVYEPKMGAFVQDYSTSFEV